MEPTIPQPPQLCDLPGCLGIARQSLAMAGGAFVCDEHCELANRVATQTIPQTLTETDAMLALIRVAEVRASLP